MRKNVFYRLLMAGAILVVLLNTWMAWRALSTLLDAERWRSHTLDALSRAEAVALQVRTTDSSARGYLLTGDKIFLERFQNNVKASYSKLNDLRQTTADNSSQLARIDYTRARINARFDALGVAVAIRQGHPHGGIEPEVLGPALSDSPDGQPTVYYCIQQIEQEEQRLLKQRENETLEARRRVLFSGAGASLLDLALLIIGFELLIRTRMDREQIAEASRKIATLNADLQGLNADLEARVEQRTRELEASNKELEAFSYSVSHDLRAPLRTIDGFSLALKEDFSDCLNDEGQDYINRVRGGVQRMGMLIDALLQLSRVTRSDVQREKLDLSQLAKLVFDELQAADPAREISFSAAPDLVVEADPRLMRIAMENLIGNAWKYTSRTPNAHVAFGSDARDGRTVYFIRDNGAGFDMQYVDRLFTAFQRLHGDRDFKGSGIGLATVSRIIRRHHGTIWATSELGSGATFFFTLEA